MPLLHGLRAPNQRALATGVHSIRHLSPVRIRPLPFSHFRVPTSRPARSYQTNNFQPVHFQLPPPPPRSRWKRVAIFAGLAFLGYTTYIGYEFLQVYREAAAEVQEIREIIAKFPEAATQEIAEAVEYSFVEPYPTNALNHFSRAMDAIPDDIDMDMWDVFVDSVASVLIQQWMLEHQDWRTACDISARAADHLEKRAEQIDQGDASEEAKARRRRYLENAIRLRAHVCEVYDFHEGVEKPALARLEEHAEKAFELIMQQMPPPEEYADRPETVEFLDIDTRIAIFDIYAEIKRASGKPLEAAYGGQQIIYNLPEDMDAEDWRLYALTYNKVFIYLFDAFVSASLAIAATGEEVKLPTPNAKPIPSLAEVIKHAHEIPPPDRLHALSRQEIAMKQFYWALAFVQVAYEYRTKVPPTPTGLTSRLNPFGRKPPANVRPEDDEEHKPELVLAEAFRALQAAYAAQGCILEARMVAEKQLEQAKVARDKGELSKEEFEFVKGNCEKLAEAVKQKIQEKGLDEKKGENWCSGRRPSEEELGVTWVKS